MMEIENNDANLAAAVQNQRDRNRRGERGSRFTDADVGDNLRDRSRDGRGSGAGGDKQVSKRVYVSNIPYTYRWQELKDLFRRQVGPVDFAEIYMNDNNKSRGCGIVEFSDTADAERAVEVMHRYELDSRQLVVRLDFEDRDKHHNRSNRDIGGGGGGGNHGGSNHAVGDRSRNTGVRDLHDELRYSLVVAFCIYFYCLKQCFYLLSIRVAKSSFHGMFWFALWQRTMCANFVIVWHIALVVETKTIDKNDSFSSLFLFSIL